MVDQDLFSNRGQLLIKHAGKFVIKEGIMLKEDDKIAVYTTPDMSVRLLVSPDDVIHAHAIEDKKSSLLESIVYIKSNAHVTQVSTISGEIGSFSSCSANGCSRSCPPGQHCSCSGHGPNCSCGSCI